MSQLLFIFSVSKASQQALGGYDYIIPCSSDEQNLFYSKWKQAANV